MNGGQTKTMSSEAITALREAIQDLLYISESDEPFEVVAWKDVREPLCQRRLLELSEHSSDSHVQVGSLDAFFKDLIKEEQWHGEDEKSDVRKYRKLVQTIRNYMPDALVVRVGQTTIDIYIVGHVPEGHWAGVKTQAIET
jgi:hypothetical protein